MAAIKSLMIVCGEASGDLNAANLAQKIRELLPEVKISAVGGPLLARAGAEVFYDIRGLSVMGFFDVLKKLPRFFALKKLILQKLRAEGVDALILVDFSGFNLRLAAAVRKKLPVIYYVSPQVWASRQGRLKSIRRFVSKMVVLFRFEEDFYRARGIDAVFAGHPLLDIVKPSTDPREFLREIGLEASKTTLCLLPGSRAQEVRFILPVMLAAVKLLQEKLSLQAIIAKSPQVDWDIYSRSLKRAGIEAKVVEGKTYDCLEAGDFALVASGTATLETAILGKPLAVIYKMGLLNYLLYRPQVRIPCIGMVNLVAGKKVVPEFVQFGARPARIAREVLRILKDPKEAQRLKADLAIVKNSLGEKGASLRAARIILTYLQQK